MTIEIWTLREDANLISMLHSASAVVGRAVGSLLAPVHKTSATDNWKEGGTIATEPAAPTFVSAVAFLGKVRNAATSGKLVDGEAEDRCVSAMYDVMKFYQTLQAGCLPTHAAVSSDGECILEWRRSEGKAIASFEGEHSYGVAIVTGTEVHAAAEDGAIGAPLVPELRDFLRRS